MVSKFLGGLAVAAHLAIPTMANATLQTFSFTGNLAHDADAQFFSFPIPPNPKST